MKTTCLLVLALLVSGVLTTKVRSAYRPVQGAKKTTEQETLRAEESKYSKPEARPSSSPTEHGNQHGDYAEPSYESFKYATAASQDYQESSAEDTGARYQAQPQYYDQEDGRSTGHQDYDSLQQLKQSQLYQQDAGAAAGRPTSGHQDYESLQQLKQSQLHQQEGAPVVVGNQIQSSQQKAAAQKYVVDGSDDKGTYYISIPMSQLLAYYQNYGIHQAKGKHPEPQVSVPIYMTSPVMTQTQAYAPQKVNYHEYVTAAYPKQTQSVISKSTKIPASVHHQRASSHQLATSNHHQAQYTPAPVEVVMNPTYSTIPAQHASKYVQYVMAHQQQLPYVHQQQQFAYVAEQAEPDYPDTAGISYVQDNSIYEQQQQHQQQPQQQQQQQQHYQSAVTTVPYDQYMLQILQQTGIQGAQEVSIHPIKQHRQHQHEAHDPVQHDFIPPQYQAQKFRESHEMQPETESYVKPAHYISAGPKTLLDSYVPSHVIAAQDANRYRERPIKLESGFLPSKINFVRSYKKRKGE